jgi:hypothetical protein
MKDYTLEKGFWNRLKMFVENVQVNDAMSEEEKGMILYNCELKLLSIAPVSDQVCSHENSLKAGYPMCDECNKWLV